MTQKAPAFGAGVRECDGDGDGLGDLDGDLDGEGLGLLDGLGLFDGVVLLEGLGLFGGVVDLVGLGLFDTLLPPVGVGVPEGLVLAVGLGVAGVVGAVGLSVGVTPADEVSVAVGPLTDSVAACTTWAVPEPQRLLGCLAGAADAGAIAGPDSKNNPAPAATAACPTRTTLTGTAALR